MKTSFAVLIVAALAAGCTIVPGSEETAAKVVQSRIEYNDTKAKGLALGLCDMSVGALNRGFDGAKWDAIQTLCSGNGKQTLKLEDVKNLADIYRRLQGEPQ